MKRVLLILLFEKDNSCELVPQYDLRLGIGVHQFPAETLLEWNSSPNHLGFCEAGPPFY